MNLSILSVMCALLLLTGCTGVGVVEAPDPYEKLNDAERLFRQYDRPIPAEGLIFQAIEIFKMRDDLQGLGDAYRDYGDLLVSSAVKNLESSYRNSGFKDKSVTFENRFYKSNEYFAKALAYYQAEEKRVLENQQYEVLTLLYLNMARTSVKINDQKMSCSYYDKGLKAFHANFRHDQDAESDSAGPDSVPELVAAGKKLIGCD